MAHAYAIDTEFISGDGSLILENIRRVKPTESTRVIEFARLAHGEIEFLGQREVLSVAERRPEAQFEESIPSLATYMLSELQEFDEPRFLSILGGSLQKTRRFLSPEWHFRFSIVALTVHDYNTIVDNDVDVPRSVYRLLFHSLPLEVQATFVRHNAELFPSFATRSTFIYRPLAERLIEFVEERVGGTLSVLKMLQETYPTGSEGVPPLDRLYLGTDEPNGAPDIPFGRDVASILGYADESPLFSVPTGSTTLLEAVLTAVREQPAGERRRSWKETIF